MAVSKGLVSWSSRRRFQSTVNEEFYPFGSEVVAGQACVVGLVAWHKLHDDEGR